MDILYFLSHPSNYTANFFFFFLQQTSLSMDYILCISE